MPLLECDIRKLLKCEICTQFYSLNEEPKLIPCFKTICSTCVDKIELKLQSNKSSYFKCLHPDCPDDHFYPKKGLPINTICSQLIAQLRLQRNQEIKDLEINLNTTEQLSQKLQFAIDNSNEKVKDHCNELRNKVRLSTEDKIKRINQNQQSHLTKINEYEFNCIQNNTKNKDLKPKIEELILKVNTFVTANKKRLYQIDFNENEITDTNEEANYNRLKLEEQYLNVESLLFNYKLLEFQASKNPAELSIGFLNYKPLAVVTNDIIISGSSDNTIKIWNIRTNSLIKNLTGHSKDINCIQLVLNETLISGSSDNTIKIWCIKTAVCTTTLIGHTKCITCLQVLLNDTIISGSDDCTVKIWRIKSKQCIHTLQGHTDYVLCIQIVTAEITASSSSDTTIKLWNIKTGKCLNTLYGHTGYVNCLQLALNHQLISGSMDKMIKVWNTKTGQCLFTLKEHWKEIKCIKCTYDDIIISGSADHTIKIWNIKTGQCITTLRGHSEDVTCLQLVSDDLLISGSVDNTVKVWNLNTKKLVKSLEGHKSWIRAIKVVSTDTVVTASEDKTIKIWNFKTGLLVNTLEGHLGSVWCLQSLSNYE